MKSFLVSALTALAFVYQASAQAPIGPGSIKLTKIAPEVVKTPDIQFTGGTKKRSTPGNWLEVEVEFEVKAEEIDELTFNYTMLIEGKLLDGTVTHINIPKGRDRYSVMYVAPRTLEKLTGGKALTPASIQNIWVQISRQGQPLAAEGYPKNVAIPPLPRLSGMVLNKGETPFAPLFFDRYEAIKVAR
jgi:hypothetical protein